MATCSKPKNLKEPISPIKKIIAIDLNCPEITRDNFFYINAAADKYRQSVLFAS
jgi:hypothetical protein